MPSTCTGFAIPVVSAIITSENPIRAKRSTSVNSRDSGTSPSYGQPNAVPIAAVHVTPAASTIALISANCVMLSWTLMRTFLRLKVSLAITTTKMASIPARSASCAPRTFGTSAS